MLRVAFRVDASVRIGSGHVMRCLTLADALREAGADCQFLCRVHDGHLNDLIAARSFAVTALPMGGAALPDEPVLAHADWLGSDWQTDAHQVVAALGGKPVDVLVVDHYALDHRWHRALRPHVGRIMVIDDLADRAHDCDLLLDQNLGRQAADYDGLVPDHAPRMIGPHHALLRPDFARARPDSLRRRGPPALRHLLITMGGVDQDNVTGQILNALPGLHLPDLTGIEVILGPSAPWVEAVREAAARMPWPTTVRVGITDMAATMARSDLAVGAAGGTSWERCCLGLPTIQIVLADNQMGAAEALDRTGAAIAVRTPGQIAETLRTLDSPDRMGDMLRRVGRSASGLVDGLGAPRVAAIILGGQHD
ncbi:UDP-2,4-diacetamido-2,4,6-trideoxy-beta-L-altropyranose hydrolase [Paracoccus sp. p4-l81]|uniref:UDP-2,4-diacetamido-2,4, 6-trideoxy-beta-L-altropyranose hydrolase n=1 Tax=Paracoccus sp. p4-l81 TaxID=3342806 RepID=UPI0035BACDCC